MSIASLAPAQPPPSPARASSNDEVRASGLANDQVKSEGDMNLQLIQSVAPAATGNLGQNINTFA